jgi:hypothetical protein
VNRVILFSGREFPAPPEGRILFQPGTYALDDRYLTSAFAAQLMASDEACDADGPEAEIFAKSGARGVRAARTAERAAEVIKGAAQNVDESTAPAVEQTSPQVTEG